jgi:hypothetical protein
MSFVIAGCSSSIGVTSFEDANGKVGKGRISICMKDSMQYEGRQLSFNRDCAIFYDNGMSQTRQIYSRDIASIQSADRIGGAMEGLIYGSAGGGVSGLALGVLFPGADGSDWTPTGAAFMGMALGGSIGLIWGSIAGHTYTYEFPRDTVIALPSSIKPNDDPISPKEFPDEK